MKQLVGVNVGGYTFDASAKQVTITGLSALDLEQILLITNVTRQEIIYQFNNTSKGATIAANVLTLEYDTTAHADTDNLQIYIDYIDQTQVVSATNLDIRDLSSATDSVTVTGTVAATLSEPISVDDNGGSLTVDGTVAVSNFPAVQPVSDNGGSLTVDGAVTVSATDLDIRDLVFTTDKVDVSGSSVTVSGTVGVTQSGTWDEVGINDSGNSITVDGTVTANPTRPATPTQSSPAPTNVNTSILASNANRLGATIYNEGAAICYMKLGSTASTTSYTLQIAVGGYYEVPFGYTGAIDGITSSGTAQLRVTELAA